jgi:CHASE2 domain-containing sensor protein
VAGLVLALVAGAGIAGPDATASLDRAGLDTQFALLRKHFPEPVQEDVRVVGVDEATAAGIAEPLAHWHRHIGDFLQAAAQAGARAVAVDLVLPDRGYDGIAPGYDARLTADLIAMRRVGALVLAQTVDEGRRPRKIHAPFVAAAGPEGIGFAIWPLDRDGVVRRFDETLGAAGEVVPTLAGRLAHQLGFVPRNELISLAIGEPISYLPLGSVLSRDAGSARRVDSSSNG